MEMTNQPRCTLHVRGLDCPSEAQVLRAALQDAPGVTSLGFDLINGLMTVDYDAEQINPQKLLRLVGERAGMEAGLVGQPQAEAPRSSWWSRHGRLASTVGSGAALGSWASCLVVGDGGGPGTGNQRAAGSRLLRTGGGLRRSVALPPCLA